MCYFYLQSGPACKHQSKWTEERGTCISVASLSERHVSLPTAAISYLAYEHVLCQLRTKVKLQTRLLFLREVPVTMRGRAEDTARQSSCEVFLERNRSAFSPLSTPQGSPKPCRQDADPHTETWSAAILEPEGGRGRALPPRSPSASAPELKGCSGGTFL